MVRKYLTGVLAAETLLIAYAVGSLAVTGFVMTVGAPTRRRPRAVKAVVAVAAAVVLAAAVSSGAVAAVAVGSGRGFWRGGVWLPWIAPGLCHESTDQPAPLLRPVSRRDELRNSSRPRKRSALSLLRMIVDGAGL